MTTSGQIIIPHGDVPVIPPAGKITIYTRPDGYVYFMANDGIEQMFASASGTSHGALSGLLDDTHTQYLTGARGDIRYYTQEQIDTISGSLQDGIDVAGDSTFMDLLDTPSVYEDGSYIRSTASGIEWVTASGTASTIENEIIVGKSGTGAQFNNIQEAIDYAVIEYPDRSLNAPVIITVHSGEYREQLNSYANIVIQSSAAAYDTVQGQAKVTLINVGDTDSTYPLRTDPGDVYYMVGISIYTDTADGILGRLPEGTFKNCSTRYGHFIENTEFTVSQFKDCKFNSNTYGGFYVESAAAISGSNVKLDTCILNGVPTFLSTHSGVSDFGFISTKWSSVRGSFNIGGDWGIQGFEQKVYQSAVRSIFDTSWEVRFQGGLQVNGMHFTSAPSKLSLLNILFDSIEDNLIPDGEADVTADVHITGRVLGNRMHNGLCSNIHMDNPDKFVGVSQRDGYISLKAALDSITDSSATKRYTIQISAGIYEEDNPLQGKEYVNTKAIGDFQTTRIVAGNPTEDLFTMANLFSLEGLAFNGVTSSGSAVYMGVPGLATISNCAVLDCYRGLRVNHSEAHLNISNIPIITLEESFTIEDVVYIEQGHININRVFPMEATTIGTILNVIGNSSAAAHTVHVSAFNITSDSANVSKGINVANGSYLSAKNCHFDNVGIGVQIQGTNTWAQLSNTEINNTTGDAVYIPNDGTNIKLSLQGVATENVGGYDLNIENESCTVYGQAKMSLNNTLISASANIYATVVDLAEDDEGLNILGELHVGSPENPTEAVFGEGDSYSRGLLAYTFDGTVYTDISTMVRSPSSSSFTFPNTNIGSAIYLASDLVVTALSDYHKYFGIKMLLSTPQIGGTIITEYYNGSAWVEYNHMTAQSSGKYYRKANLLFTVDAGTYQVRFDPSIDVDWAKSNDPAVDVNNRYWVRFRITSPPSTLPVFEQFKLHSSRHEINSDGFEEDMGTARPVIGISVPWSTFQDAVLKLDDKDLFVSDNSYAGMVNNKFNANGQSIGTVMTLPPWVDTSGKMTLVVSIVPKTSGTLVLKAFVNSSNDGDVVAVVAPGNTIGELVSIVSKSVVATEQITYQFNLDISGKGLQADGATPEILWINLEADSIPGEVYGIVFNVEFLSWRRGTHI